MSNTNVVSVATSGVADVRAGLVGYERHSIVRPVVDTFELLDSGFALHDEEPVFAAEGGLVWGGVSEPPAAVEQVVVDEDEDLFELLNPYDACVAAASMVTRLYRSVDRMIEEAPRDDFRVALPITHVETTGLIGLWIRAKGHIKRAALNCCCGSDVVRSWDREVTLDRAVRHEMLLVDALPVRTTVAVVDENGEAVEQEPERMTTEELMRNVVEAQNTSSVQHIPKLVANVVVALRMKLGVSAMNRSVPGNVVLVRAEAARMMRDWNVRTKDAAAHLMLVERCFFRDDAHYQVSTWRARQSMKSRFVNWIIGSEDLTSFDF